MDFKLPSVIKLELTTEDSDKFLPSQTNAESIIVAPSVKDEDGTHTSNLPSTLKTDIIPLEKLLQKEIKVEILSDEENILQSGDVEGCSFTQSFDDKMVTSGDLRKQSENEINRTDTCLSGFTSDIYTKILKPATQLDGQKNVQLESQNLCCAACPKYFLNPSDLATHELVHKYQKFFYCDLCSQCFKSSSLLSEHWRIHTEKRSYECDICSKTFSRSYLQAHKRIHTRERPFSCDLCSESFLHSSHLQEHKQVHTGERPYSCDVCSKSFTLSSNLSAHRRTHTGERPFSCNLCSKSFTRCSSLHNHKLIHARKQPNA